MSLIETTDKAKDQARCPACNRPLYDRRRHTCGYCGQEVAEDQCFSEPQTVRISSQRKAEEKKHQAFKDILEAFGPHDHSPIL